MMMKVRRFLVAERAIGEYSSCTNSMTRSLRPDTQ